MSPTTAESRFRLLQEVGKNRLELGLPLSRVQQMDRYLRSEWGISPPISLSDWAYGLDSVAGAGIASKYRYLHDRRANYISRGKPAPIDLDTRFYDLIAHPSISGYVHSQKRTLILDTAALLDALITFVGIEGKVLDVGCHVGYHAHWLAIQHSHLSVQGMDISREAIKSAISKCEGVRNLHFSTDGLADAGEGSHDLIFASDSLQLDGGKHADELLRKLSASLREGGLLVLFGCQAGDRSLDLQGALEKYTLGYALADVVGGVVGADRGFNANSVLILVKGIDNPLARDYVEEAKSAWPAFRDYANAPDTPEDEKTQAYHRAKAAAESLINSSKAPKPRTSV